MPRLLQRRCGDCDPCGACVYSDPFSERRVGYETNATPSGTAPEFTVASGVLTGTGDGSYTRPTPKPSAGTTVFVEASVSDPGGSTSTGVTVRAATADERVSLSRVWGVSDGYELRWWDGSSEQTASFTSSGAQPIKLEIAPTVTPGEYDLKAYVGGVLEHTESGIAIEWPDLLNLGVIAEGGGEWDDLRFSPCPFQGCDHFYSCGGSKLPAAMELSVPSAGGSADACWIGDFVLVSPANPGFVGTDIVYGYDADGELAPISFYPAAFAGVCQFVSVKASNIIRMAERYFDEGLNRYLCDPTDEPYRASSLAAAEHVPLWLGGVTLSGSVLTLRANCYLIDRTNGNNPSGWFVVGMASYDADFALGDVLDENDTLTGSPFTLNKRFSDPNADFPGTVTLAIPAFEAVKEYIGCERCEPLTDAPTIVLTLPFGGTGGTPREVCLGRSVDPETDDVTWGGAATLLELNVGCDELDATFTVECVAPGEGYRPRWVLTIETAEGSESFDLTVLSGRFLPLSATVSGTVTVLCDDRTLSGTTLEGCTGEGCCDPCDPVIEEDSVLLTATAAGFSDTVTLTRDFPVLPVWSGVGSVASPCTINYSAYFYCEGGAYWLRLIDLEANVTHVLPVTVTGTGPLAAETSGMFTLCGTPGVLVDFDLEPAP